MKPYQYIISATLFAASYNAAAEDWTLQQCIDYALEHNIDIKMRQQDVATGNLQVADSKHAFFREINASASE